MAGQEGAFSWCNRQCYEALQSLSSNSSVSDKEPRDLSLMKKRRQLTLFSLTSGLLSGCLREGGRIDPLLLYFLIVKFKCEKHLQNFYNVNVYSSKTENVQIPFAKISYKKLCNLLAFDKGFPKSYKMLKSNAGSRSKYRFRLA